MPSSSQRISEIFFSASALFLAVGFFVIGVVNPARFAGIFFGIGGLLYGYCLYKSGFVFKNIFKEFYPISYLLLSYCGVLVMALLSIHFAFDTKQTLKAIIIFLIFPLILALCFYFVIKNLPQESLRFFLILLGVAIFAHPVATIYNYLTLHQERATGFHEALVIPYSETLILAFALSVAMLLYLRGKWQFIAVLSIILSSFAMYANGTRALILSVGAMLFVALFFLQNHKKIIIPLALVLGIGVSIGGIAVSSHLSDRFNFEKMLNRIGVVWSYSPAAMGRFDVFCFTDYEYRCSKLSGNELDKRFAIDSSTLGRLSLWKSAILAIEQNPFRPNGFYPRFFDKNIQKIFKPDSINYPYPLDRAENIGYYDHIHNTFLSFIFELGLIGFLFVVLSIFGIFFYITKYFYRVNDFYQKVFICCFVIFLFGQIMSMLFDSMLSFPKFNYLFFILIGVALGVASRKSKIAGENEH